MADPLIEVRAENVEQVAKTLARDAPEAFKGAQMEAMKESMVDLKAALQGEMAESKWTGTAHRRIRQRITGKPGNPRFKGRVTTVRYGHLIEFGRRPGRAPFSEQAAERIRRWAKDKLGDERLWFVVARAIARKGSLRGKREGFDSGWAHMRIVVRDRRDQVIKYFHRAIERAARILIKR